MAIHPWALLLEQSPGPVIDILYYLSKPGPQIYNKYKSTHAHGENCVYIHWLLVNIIRNYLIALNYLATLGYDLNMFSLANSYPVR